MKFAKWLAAIAVILLVAVIAANLYRDNIARNIADRSLRELGIIASELSVDRVTVSQLDLSRLVLVQDNGNRYEMDDVRIPLSLSATGVRKVHIGRAQIFLAQSDTAPTPLSEWLGLVLQLPETVASTEVSVGEAVVPFLPPLTDLSWKTHADGQSLSIAFGKGGGRAEVTQIKAGEHVVKLESSLDGTADVLTLSLNVARSAGAYQIDGAATIDVGHWLPALRAIDLVPTQVHSFQATLSGPVSMSISDADSPPAVVNFLATPARLVSLEYLFEDDSITQVTSLFSAPTSFSYDLSSASWQARLGDAYSTVTIAGDEAMQVATNNMVCRTGISCSLDANIELGETDFNEFSVSSGSVAAQLALQIEDETVIDIAPGAWLLLTDISAPGVSLDSLESTDSSAASVAIRDEGWHAEAASVQLLGQGFELDSVRAELWMNLHAVQLDGGLLNFSLELSNDGFDAAADIRHDLGSGKGSMRASQFSADFSAAHLSSYFDVWSADWDVLSGTFTGDSEVTWDTSRSSLQYSGAVKGELVDLAGTYQDSAFVGGGAIIDARLHHSRGLSLSPMKVGVALVDIGVPLEAITANIEFDVDDRVANVSGLSMSVMGGTLRAKPFRYEQEATSNSLVLMPAAIGLQQIVDRADISELSVTGSLSGEIPIEISEHAITVSDGRLNGDSEGGTIRYRKDAAAIADDSLSLVVRALGNFEYASLDSVVHYSEEGDLVLQTRIEGISPDVDETQPVILNLNIENNVPALLKSLRAARSVQDVLEKRIPEKR